MRKNIILILILLPSLCFAQNCNCSDNFKFLVEKVKKNYVGYSDKINKSNQQQFNVFTDSLQKIANSAEKMKCFDICAEWLTYFKDGHLSMYFTPEKAPADTIKAFLATAEKTSWNEHDFNTYLQGKKGKLDQIEGYWTYGSNNYKIGIVKDTVYGSNEFIGFIIRTTSPYWIPQQVKLRIKKVNDNYQLIYTRSIDHSKVFPGILLNKDVLDLGSSGKWYKSRFLEDKEEGITWAASVESPSFSSLDKETNLLVIPSFSITYKKAVDSLIEANKSLLEKSKHLVIDIRNNQGGLIGTFEKLLPYIYTNPIYNSGAALLATADNLDSRYNSYRPGLPEETKKRFQKAVEKMKNHVGELYPVYPADTTVFTHVLKNPQRVSILINGGSASAAELFILKAEQSKKVTLFGQNSAGSVDYVENILAKIPCSYFSVQYPAVRFNSTDTRPLSNVGIAPNVIIPHSVQNWIEFVRNYKPVH